MSVSSPYTYCFFVIFADYRYLLSFPTRRSSDLRFGGATCDDKSAQIYARFKKMIGVSNLQSFIASMTQKLTLSDISDESDRKSGSAGMPRPISYAVFCLKKKRTIMEN